MSVVLDTNFLVLMFTKKIDIFEELNYILNKPVIIVFDIVLKELKKVKPNMYESMVSLLKLKQVKIKKVETKLSVDDFLLEYSIKNNCYLATLDRVLKQKALKRGLPLISIRGKKLETR